MIMNERKDYEWGVRIVGNNIEVNEGMYDGNIRCCDCGYVFGLEYS